MTHPRSKPDNSPYRLQVLDRALGILEVLWKEGPDLTVPDIAERVGLNIGTVRRFVKVLEQHRMVEKNSQNGKYRLGLRLFELGSSAVAQINLRERARPYLDRLVLETGETAHLCILDEGKVLYLEKMESPHAIRMASWIGRRNPSHCSAVGKAILAFLSEEEVDAFIKKYGLAGHTRNTITKPTRFKDELQNIVKRGYAVDNEESVEGLRCVGAPIRDYSGQVIASISIAGPTFRVTEEKAPSLAKLVMDVANKLSAEIGYSTPAG